MNESDQILNVSLQVNNTKVLALLPIIPGIFLGF